MSQLSHAQFPLRRHPDLLVDHRRARSAAVAEPRGANDESRDRLRWPASFRNGGRNQIGTVADIKSESPAGLPRNSQLLPIRRRNDPRWRAVPRVRVESFLLARQVRLVVVDYRRIAAVAKHLRA